MSPEEAWSMENISRPGWTREMDLWKESPGLFSRQKRGEPHARERTRDACREQTLENILHLSFQEGMQTNWRLELCSVMCALFFWETEV